MLKISSHLDKYRYGDGNLSESDIERPIIKRAETKKSIVNKRIIIRDNPGPANRKSLQQSNKPKIGIQRKKTLNEERFRMFSSSPGFKYNPEANGKSTIKGKKSNPVIYKASSQVILQKMPFELYDRKRSIIK